MSAQKGIAGLLLLLVTSACGHPKSVTPNVPVRERVFWGIPAEALDGDAFCVPAEDAAGPPVQCVSIAAVRAFVRGAKYAP